MKRLLHLLSLIIKFPFLVGLLILGFINLPFYRLSKWVWTKQYIAWTMYKLKTHKLGKKIPPIYLLSHIVLTNFLFPFISLFGFIKHTVNQLLAKLIGIPFNPHHGYTKSSNPNTIK